MKPVRKSRSKVVEGVVVSRSTSLVRSPLAPVAARSAPLPSNWCPVCRERAASVPVAIGAVRVEVCGPCAEPILDAMSAAGAISRLLLRWF